MKEVSAAYRQWIMQAPQVGRLGWGKIKRGGTIIALEKAGRSGEAQAFKSGIRQRLTSDETVIVKTAALRKRRTDRGGPAFDATMRKARADGIRRLLPQADEIIDARLVECRLCSRVFVRLLAATAQKYCPACRQRYSPKERWSQHLLNALSRR